MAESSEPKKKRFGSNKAKEHRASNMSIFIYQRDGINDGWGRPRMETDYWIAIRVDDDKLNHLSKHDRKKYLRKTTKIFIDCLNMYDGEGGI